MLFNLDIDFGDLVVLKTDDEKKPRHIIAVIIKPGNEIIYRLCYGDEAYTEHYFFEIDWEGANGF